MMNKIDNRIVKLNRKTINFSIDVIQMKRN